LGDIVVLKHQTQFTDMRTWRNQPH